MKNVIMNTLSSRGISLEEVRMNVLSNGPDGAMDKFGINDIVKWLSFLKEFMNNDELSRSYNNSGKTYDEILADLAYQIIVMLFDSKQQIKELERQLEEERKRSRNIESSRKLEAMRLMGEIQRLGANG